MNAATAGAMLNYVEGQAGRLRLNRPKTIHALNLDMVRLMTASLVAWKGYESLRAVLLDHNDGRGFCSGGDINLLRQSALGDGGAVARTFFREEYQLNHLLFTFPRPVISFMDGITMGGGVGISQPARYRVATENTRFAMPETGIGLFPDVGGGWYLSRLKGRMGHYLGLSGARLDGSECLLTGVATHFLPSDCLPEVKERIAAGDQPPEVLDAYAITPPEARVARNAEAIARHYAFDRFEDILASLAGDASEWAVKELAILRTKSPFACKITLRQLVDSLACADFAENMVMEYRISSRMVVLPDFVEGVRAVIVDKDYAPKWNPATPDGVTDAMIDAIFAPLPVNEEWKPL